jgi:hypothetical protein
LHVKIVRYSLLLLIVLAISVSWPRVVPVPAPNPAGQLEHLAGVDVVYLQGAPYEMGLQQGTLLRDPLRDLVSNYLHGHMIAGSSASHASLLSLIRLLEPGIPNALRREMQGIADGAGLSYQDVLLLNIVPDLLTLTYQLPSWQLSPSLTDSASLHYATAVSIPHGIGCDATALSSSFAAWGPATDNGQLVIGQNLRFVHQEQLRRHWVLAVRRPAQGNAFVSLALMGTVGVWMGMSEEQITVNLAGAPSVDVASHGCPLPFLLRQVLQTAGDLTQAMNLLLASSRLYGGTLLLGDGKAPDAVAIDLSAHRLALYEAAEDMCVLARTNHFVQRDLAATQRAVLAGCEEEASVARLDRLLTVLELNSGWISTEKGLTMLRDDRQAQLESSAGVAHGDQAEAAPHSVLLCPSSLMMWVGRLHASEPQSGSVSPVLTEPYLALDVASLFLAYLERH